MHQRISIQYLNLPQIQFYNKQLPTPISIMEKFMPIYEYHCKTCGNNFELMLRFSEAGNYQICPNCNDNQTHKKLSSFAALGGMNSSTAGNSGSNCNSRGVFN